MRVVPPRASRVAVAVAVILATAWLLISVALNGRLVNSYLRNDYAGGAWLGFLLYGFAGLTFVGVPATLAGVVAVSATRTPGTGAVSWWVARAAFVVSLSGPAEALAVALLFLVLWITR
jgi:hypothetical protein